MDELLKKFKKFQTRSKAGFSELYDRIKHDREIVSGRQWSKSDDKFISKARNRITLNVISNTCNSVSNSYSVWPFSWQTRDTGINEQIKAFFRTDSNRFAVEEALLDAVSFGMGVIAIGSDTDPSGNEVPVIYSVTDTERVMLDPASTELDGSDMTEAALIDYRSRDWIRINIGEQYLPSEKAKMVVTSASCASLVPIITYYQLDTDGVHVCTFVNESLVEGSEITLGIHRIPLFPVWGERTWDDQDRKTYQGLIAKSESIQRIVNYSMTQLVERLQLSPKPQWKGYLESFKDLQKYYTRAGTGENPTIPAQRLANDNKTQLPLPERVDNQIQYTDVQGIVNGTLDMLPSITGVDSKGLADVETEVTATAARYTEKVFANNIRHFIQHLRTSFKALGDTMMVLMGHANTTVEVIQGPEAYMQNQIARSEITALMGLVEPAMKPTLMKYLLKTYPDNDTLTTLLEEMEKTPQPTAMEMEMQQTIEKMKLALDQKNAEILKLTEQVDTMQRQQESQRNAYLFELKKMELEHQYKQEDTILSAQLNSGADAAKERAEVERAQLGVQRELVALQKEEEKANAQHAENIAKLTASMFGNGGMF